MQGKNEEAVPKCEQLKSFQVGNMRKNVKIASMLGHPGHMLAEGYICLRLCITQSKYKEGRINFMGNCSGNF